MTCPFCSPWIQQNKLKQTAKVSQLLSNKRAGRAGGINWVFLSDSSVAGARQMLRRCTCTVAWRACFAASGQALIGAAC